MFMQCVCLEIIIGHLVSEKDGANMLLSILSVAGSLPLTYHSFDFLFQGRQGKIVQGLVIAVDLVYKWVLLDGTLKNPKRFQIVPDIKIPFTCIRLEIKGCLEQCKF